MRRRDFMAALSAAAAVGCSAALAEPVERPRRVGVLMGIANDLDVEARLAAFRRRLGELGWQDGKNARIEILWADGDAVRFRSHAASLVKAAPDVILATSPPALAVLRQETSTIPIVFMMVPDPARSGIVSSLAKPGGNITGIMNYEYGIGAKWIEILKQIAPTVSQVLVINNPRDPTWAGYSPIFEGASRSLEIGLHTVDIFDLEQAERKIGLFGRAGNGGLLVLPTPLTTVHREAMIDLAKQYSLPAIYPYRYFVSSGGLVSYGIQGVDLYRRAAEYVGRILSGAKPSGMPIVQPTKLELVINLKTAKALGLTVSRVLLAAADEVID